jgi:predicted nucleic acid-binding protein
MDRDEQRKREIALELISSAGGSMVVSAQVLAEFYVVATRGLSRPLPEPDAARRIDELSRLRVMPIDAELVRAAIRLSGESRLSSWDAAIVVAAAAAGCSKLLSEDLQEGGVVAGVRIENPFAAV